MTEPLHVALSLARHGFHVFPVGEDKVPRLKGWPSAATTDPETIATWWTGDYEGALVGIACGPSGVVAVDIDRDKGEGEGDWNLRRAGLVPPPTGLEYKTRSGGRHLLYRAPAGVELTTATGTPVPGVDIRSGNGFVVYWGDQLRKAPELGEAPEWAIVRKASSAPARGGDVATWLDRQRPGKPSKATRKAAAKIARNGTSHADVLEAVAAIVAAGTRGERGAGRLLAEARERYVADWPDYARAFDAAVEGSVRHHGTPPQTFELSKAERRALRARGRDAEPEAVDPEPSVYVDVAAVLAGKLEAPKPDAGGVRADGERMLYRGAVNGIVGEPEAGKTLVATAWAADELRLGGSVLWVDADFNGAPATLARLRAADVPLEVLVDHERFRLVVPDTAAALATAVTDAPTWRPSVAVVDSVGEVMPLLGGDSNDADDYSRVHRAVFAPLAAAGAAVVVLDHLAKTSAGSGYASGTGAKKRAMDGAYYSIKLVEAFRPGAGGAAALGILKDRHGGVRATTPSDTAAVFRLDSRGGSWSFEFHPGRSDQERADERLNADVAFVLALPDFPSSRPALQAAVKAANGSGPGWGNDRAHAALKAARERREHLSTFPTDSTD